MLKELNLTRKRRGLGIKSHKRELKKKNKQSLFLKKAVLASKKRCARRP
jgi:hypothetical protein